MHRHTSVAVYAQYMYYVYSHISHPHRVVRGGLPVEPLLCSSYCHQLSVSHHDSFRLLHSYTVRDCMFWLTVTLLIILCACVLLYNSTLCADGQGQVL